MISSVDLVIEPDFLYTLGPVTAKSITITAYSER
jgi:hypothetical protein